MTPNAYKGHVEFGVLGPVEVRAAGRVLPGGGARERTVLALLLLDEGRLTPADRLIDVLWGASTPPSARAQLHNIVSGLRRRIGHDLVVTKPSGYELHLGEHSLDLQRFRELTAMARLAAERGDHEQALDELAGALGLWRGAALADVAEVADEALAGVRRSLHEERLAAAEAMLDAALALGRFDDVLRELPALLVEHPYRERLHEVHLLALVGAGRRADALAAYQQVFRLFADDLGVEPGSPLRELELRILDGETPTPSGRPVPRQLPPMTGPLTGRDKLLGEIAAELRRPVEGAPPVVVLVGPGGVGKTSLAVAAAAGCGEDGQLYADLRGSHRDPADPHAVTGRFLRALGVAGAAVPDDRDERVALYRSRLAGRRVLVVLDDAGGEEQVRALLPAGAGCATLVTSRRQLGALVGAARWTIPVLAPSDALQVLALVVGRARVHAEPAAAEAIVAACGRLPLAVTVAAARLAARREWTLAEFVRRLSDERGRLDELAVGDLDVRASIALSYRMLEPDQRRLLRLLGLVTAPDWPAWVVPALLDDPAGTRLHQVHVDDLVDVHLVEPLGRDGVGQHRFRLHDLVAEFAAEQAAEGTDGDEAVRRVCSGWLALATEADERVGHGMASADGLDAPPLPWLPNPGAPRWPARDWFEVERASLADAVEHAVRLGAADLAGRLALRTAGFCALRGYHDDRDHLLSRALDAVRAAGGHDRLRLRLLNALFAIRAELSRDAELPAIAAEQVTLARGLGERRLGIRALANVSMAARRQGRLADAADAADRCVAECDESDPPDLTARMLHDRARVHSAAGEPHAAAALSERSLAMLGDGARRIRAMHLVTYGWALIECDRLDDAERALGEAAAIVRSIRDEIGASSVDHALAEVETRRGTWEPAARRLARTLRFMEANGDLSDQVQVLGSMGVLAMLRGRPHDALEPLERARSVAARLGDPLLTVRTLALLERAHVTVGDDGAAATHRAAYQAILSRLGLDERCLRLPPPSVDHSEG